MLAVKVEELQDANEKIKDLQDRLETQGEMMSTGCDVWTKFWIRVGRPVLRGILSNILQACNFAEQKYDILPVLQYKYTLI
jgi:hypothetical protein